MLFGGEGRVVSENHFPRMFNHLPLMFQSQSACLRRMSPLRMTARSLLLKYGATNFSTLPDFLI